MLKSQENHCRSQQPEKNSAHNNPNHLHTTAWCPSYRRAPMITSVEGDPVPSGQQNSVLISAMFSPQTLPIVQSMSSPSDVPRNSRVRQHSWRVEFASIVHGRTGWRRTWIVLQCCGNDSQNISLHIFQRDPRTNLEWNRTYLLFFPKNPTCDIFERTKKITRNPCRRNPASREDRLAQSTTFGDTIAAEHKDLNEENKSRLQHRFSGQWDRIWWSRAETRLHKILWKTCSDSYFQRASLDSFTLIIQNSSQKLAKSCRGNRTSLRQHRSETNPSGERAVRREKEGTNFNSVNPIMIG